MIEYGYYTDDDHFVVGAIRATRQDDLLLGYRRQLSAKVQLSLDFQSGAANSTTAGVTYAFTPDLSINPAVYVTNGHPHHCLGYVVLAWNLALWKK